MPLLGVLAGCNAVLGLDEFGEAASGGEGITAGGSEGYVRIAPGTLTVGSPPGEIGRSPQERPFAATISRAFLIARTEVTQSAWFDVTGESPARFGACGSSCPVESVSWYEAVAFCNALSIREDLPVCYVFHDEPYDFDHAEAGVEPQWKAGLDCEGYRLPTEAEWEYAARAGSEAAFHTGEIQSGGCLDAAMREAGWFCGNSDVSYAGCDDVSPLGGPRCAGPHPVGEKSANDWGLVDAHGNVAEWVWNWEGEYPLGSETDPTGPALGVHRIARGGHWFDTAADCRAAKRGTFPPSDRSSFLGLRPVRSLP